jgi:hypothetical protein
MWTSLVTFHWCKKPTECDQRDVEAHDVRHVHYTPLGGVDCSQLWSTSRDSRLVRELRKGVESNLYNAILCNVVTSILL